MATGHAEYDAIIQDIVEYVYHGQINSESAYTRARLALLDALGCAIETLHLSPDCRVLVGPVIPGTLVPGGVRIPGTGYIVDPLKGAFDLGSLIRYLDHNDAYAGAEWGHPSDNLGAILSVADWLSQQHAAEGQPRVTLHTVLTAQIKAYEIQGILQQTNAFNARGLDHVILVKVASTAVVVWMLGLPESAALSAVSHAWIDGHPLRTYRQSPNAGPRKGWAAGDACMRAVHLALLTQRAGRLNRGTSSWLGGAAVGVPTAITAPRWGFSDALYGGKAITRGYAYGSRVVETVLFKLITAEGHGISTVEAAAKVATMLRARQLVAERDVRAIRIRTQKPAVIIIDKTGPLRNNADRDHSLQYMVAVTLLKQAVVDTADYLDDSPWATDPRVDALRKKMTVTEDAGFTAGYYDPEVRSVASAIEVQLDSGEVLDEVVVEFPIGHHKRAETLDGVMAKFRRNMSSMFAPEEVERVIQAAHTDDLTVAEFMALFARPEKATRTKL
ncbi:2-methylcitrate dehydratase [Pleurostoma richardsiae]|uniref:2-methylcitrate dehydratase n=1 Tax=Pleurostoma richardsiae TaxID=41990 RepID=A0AA38VE20_9PEZI|nr:2-methylcitrate dehydratase [Pleurostoma richardsiae]